jgi:hypothetical protein
VDADQAQVGFIDERGRLQSVLCSFAPHVSPGHPVQIGVDKRDEAIE